MLKEKAARAITPSGFSSNCQSGRSRCWNDSIDPKERFHPLQGILSRYGRVALLVASSSESGLAYGCNLDESRPGAGAHIGAVARTADSRGDELPPTRPPLRRVLGAIQHPIRGRAHGLAVPPHPWSPEQSCNGLPLALLHGSS
jgi:hypothetical protein